jgi:hypothetical protein|tara:strand:- start:199 stop:951 length:753 start_codon:yes stop_codon:yes gene_type:complete
MSDGVNRESFIAFSGGVESTCMTLMFHHKATPVCTDTGWEHDELYRWIETVEERLGISVVRLKAKKRLQDHILEKKFYPSGMKRFCTVDFKIKPMDEFLKTKTPCEVMIGLNAEETDRTGNHGLCEGVTYSYPLIDLGITRAAAIALLTEYDLLPKFPGYMRRGGCVGCFWKSKREYALMAIESPAEADSVANLEEAIQDERGKFYSVRDGIPNMRKFIEAERRQQRLDFGPDYDDMGEIPTSCGVFCRR